MLPENRETENLTYKKSLKTLSDIMCGNNKARLTP